MSEYNFQQMKLIKDLSISEKFLEILMKIVGYGIGNLTILHKLTLSGFKISEKIFSQQSTSYEENGETIYRRLEAKDKLLDNFNNIQTLTELIDFTFQTNADKPCMGSRETLKRIQVPGVATDKLIFTQQLGVYKWKTFNEVYVEVKCMCSFLKSIKIDTENRLAIFADTSSEWLISALAAFYAHSSVVTVYTSLSNENIKYALCLTKPAAILVDINTIPRIASLIPLIPSIKTVIGSHKGTDDKLYLNNYQLKDILFIHYNEIISKHLTNISEIKAAPSLPTDIAVVMFTSGSSGLPKAVLISHKNIISLIGSVVIQKKLLKDLLYTAYLPLAHIMELCMELSTLAYGKQIGYCSTLTLTDSSTGLCLGCKGDLTLLKPTVFPSVPLIMERIMKAVIDKLHKESRMKQLIFQTAYNIKAYYLGKGYQTPIINYLVFTKLQNMLGGKLKIALFGGCIMNKFTEEWFQVCFFPFKNCYGSTELCSGGSLPNVDYYRPGNCGPPFGCSEWKLVEWKEGGYFPNDPTGPKGELAIYGNSVALFYLTEEGLKETYVIDEKTGKKWHYSGDIGEILPDGTLKIIDRKKDICKLIHGEYIALAQVEGCIMACRYVEQAFVHPDTNYECLVCVTVPNKNNLRELEELFNLTQECLEIDKLINHPTIIKAVSDDILRLIKNSGLNKYEIPKKIVIVNDEWTPESGLLTASMKLRRTEIAKKYAHLFEL